MLCTCRLAYQSLYYYEHCFYHPLVPLMLVCTSCTGHSDCTITRKQVDSTSTLRNEHKWCWQHKHCQSCKHNRECYHCNTECSIWAATSWNWWLLWLPLIVVIYTNCNFVHVANMLYVFIKMLMLYISYALESKLKLFLVYTARVISKGWRTPGSSLSGHFLTECEWLFL